MLKLLGCIALVVGLTAPGVRASEWRGTVRIVDGDTMDVGGVRVRLHGIDAPEQGQPCDGPTGQQRDCGTWVTDEVRGRWEGADARCRPRDRDRYGRIVARCFVDGTDVARQIVFEGLAFAYRRFSEEYAPEEQAALAANRGVHAYALQAPANYRQRGRAKIDTSGCRIKGNIGSRGVRIYHMPGQAFYTRTRVRPGQGERWFCSATQARAAGWRAARR